MNQNTGIESHRSIRDRVYEITSDKWGGGPLGVAFDIAIVSLILLSILAVVLESVDSIGERYRVWFAAFEVFAVSVFTIEYLLRVWSCTADPRYAHPVRGRLRFMASPLAIIDLLAILPFYLPFVGVDLRSLRVFRLLRLLRLAKLGRYTRALGLIWRVMLRVRYELVSLAVVVVCFVLVASVLMYYAERSSGTEGFDDIPSSMLWTVTNLTPLSATSAKPLTVLGKLLSVCVAIVGVGIIALPTGIVGAGLVEELRAKRIQVQVCPHCSKPLGFVNRPADSPQSRSPEA
ncbi:MAG: ion transporter [Phycisphaerales bacterium]|nr:ion transporter [Phycisphaerales bacterium]MCB9837453.1 ion transporter [Phycisphaera sp.]